jgi:hypothetical protein
VSARSHLTSSPRGWFALAAVLLAASPASSQVLESASDSPSGSCELESAWPNAASTPAVEPVKPGAPLFNEDRILGVMPDYQTVRDTTHFVTPLTVREKWMLAVKETADPFNIATGFLTAAESQAGNNTPKFGEGWGNYGRRVYAAQLDFATQNFFSAGVLSSVLHQDPRYYRRGPQSKFVRRIFYSMSQLFVAHQDSGRRAFNASGIGGMSLGIAASNLYYPSASRTGTVMFGRVWTSLMGGAVGNLMSEFWPDLEQRFFKHK